MVTPQFLTQLLLLRSIHRQRIEQLSRSVGEPEYIPSRPIDVLHLFLVVHDQNGRWHGIQNLIGGSLQVLDFLRLQGHLIGQTCEGGLQLPVHAVELFRECLQLIAGLNLNGLPQFPASNRLRGLLQLPNRRDDSRGREIAQCCQQSHGDGAKHGHPCEQMLDRPEELIRRLPDKRMPRAGFERSIGIPAGLRQRGKSDDR